MFNCKKIVASIIGMSVIGATAMPVRAWGVYEGTVIPLNIEKTVIRWEDADFTLLTDEIVNNLSENGVDIEVKRVMNNSNDTDFVEQTYSEITSPSGTFTFIANYLAPNSADLMVESVIYRQPDIIDCLDFTADELEAFLHADYTLPPGATDVELDSIQFKIYEENGELKITDDVVIFVNYTFNGNVFGVGENIPLSKVSRDFTNDIKAELEATGNLVAGQQNHFLKNEATDFVDRVRIRPYKENGTIYHSELWKGATTEGAIERETFIKTIDEAEPSKRTNGNVFTFDLSILNIGEDAYSTTSSFSVRETSSAPGLIRDETTHSYTYNLLSTKEVDGVALDSNHFDGQPVNYDETIVIPSETTKTTILKVDEEGNGITGAELALMDGDDELCRFTSDEDGFNVEALVAGHTYTIHEIEAPKGYKLAEDVEFTVNETAEVEIVRMVDEVEGSEKEKPVKEEEINLDDGSGNAAPVKATEKIETGVYTFNPIVSILKLFLVR